MDRKLGNIHVLRMRTPAHNDYEAVTATVLMFLARDRPRGVIDPTVMGTSSPFCTPGENFLKIGGAVNRILPYLVNDFATLKPGCGGLRIR